MDRIGFSAVTVLVGIPLLIGAVLFALFVAAIVAFNFAVGDEPKLKYMFDDDDPAAVVPVSFDMRELAVRLDASGHLHGDGGWGWGGPTPREEVLLDNDCLRAWFRAEEGGAEPALRILGLGPQGSCRDVPSREEMVALFRDEFVVRLEGRLPPLEYREPDEGEFYAYPPGAVPTLPLTGTLLDAQERLDARPFFRHEVHDGVYYMEVCGGRFRLFERPELGQVELVGIGYVKPCAFGNDDACLLRSFQVFLLLPDDPTPVPRGPTPAASTCAIVGD